MKRLLSTRVSFGVLGALVGAVLGLAVTGGFPDAMQDPLANAVRHVGINLPGGADVHPVARVPSERTADSGTAFNDPARGVRDEEPKRYSSRASYESSCYASEACRAFFGVDEEESEDESARFDPEESEDESVRFDSPPQSDSGGYNSGQLGEPGQPGIPDEGNDESGDSDGTPGEAGPPGDPG